MNSAERSESGAVLMELGRQNDSRGWTMQIGVPAELEALDVPSAWPYEIVSYSYEGVLRGLHHQPGLAKLVRVTSGAIHEVVVDLRRDTFGAVEEYLLNPSRQLYVPPWCAHGFFVYPTGAEIHYRLSCRRAPESEVEIHWRSIDHVWPSDHVFVSDKDSQAPSLEEVRERLWPGHARVSEARG